PTLFRSGGGSRPVSEQRGQLDDEVLIDLGLCGTGTHVSSEGLAAAQRPDADASGNRRGNLRYQRRRCIDLSVQEDRSCAFYRIPLVAAPQNPGSELSVSKPWPDRL